LFKDVIKCFGLILYIIEHILHVSFESWTQVKKWKNWW